MGGNIPGGMIQVGNYAIPDSVGYNRETPDYVKNPLPHKINLVNLTEVISAVGVRIEEGQTIDPIVFEGIGKAINTARSENGGLPKRVFLACYGEKLDEIANFFVPYVTARVDSWRDSMNGRGADDTAHEEVARLLSIAKTYFPELNEKLQTAQELVEEYITPLEGKKPVF